MLYLSYIPSLRGIGIWLVFGKIMAEEGELEEQLQSNLPSLAPGTLSLKPSTIKVEAPKPEKEPQTPEP